MFRDQSDAPFVVAPSGARGHSRDVDLRRIEAAVREILSAVGEDPDREGLVDTPARVARSWADLTAGMREHVHAHLGRVFEHEGDGPVIVRDIPFYSLCEHHLLPFHGRAHVAYVPDGHRVVGLSKVARTVDVFARRLQLQERLTRQIADAMNEELRPRGVLVAIESEHMCMQMRGVEKPGGSMVTIAAHGDLKTIHDRQAQILDLLGLSRRNP